MPRVQGSSVLDPTNCPVRRGGALSIQGPCAQGPGSITKGPKHHSYGSSVQGPEFKCLRCRVQVLRCQGSSVQG